jgi:hypothetical protein
MRDQPVGGGELAAQLPLLRAHALAERSLRLPDLDDVAFHGGSLFIAGARLS